MGTAEKIKNTPLLKLASRVLEKKAAGRGAKEILSDIGGKLKSDHRFWATPAGAAAGLLLSRKIIPEEDRNVFNQGVGTAAGAGVGYTAGSLLNANKPMTDDSFFSTVLESDEPPTPALLKEMRSRGFDAGIKGIPLEQGNDPTNYMAQKARATQPMFAQLMWYRIKMQLAKKHGREDIYNKAQKEVMTIENNIDSVGMGPLVNSWVNKLSRKINNL